MRKCSLLLVLILTRPYGFSWQQTSKPAPPPLTDEERREVLWQLLQLNACLGETAALKEASAREREQDRKEQDLAARALEIEKQATALAQKERDLALEKASLYEQLYKTATKKRGTGCMILKIVTLGLARCG